MEQTSACCVCVKHVVLNGKHFFEGEENLAIRILCENKVGTLFILSFYLSDFHVTQVFYYHFIIKTILIYHLI